MTATAMMPIVFRVVQTSVVQMLIPVVLVATLGIFDRLLVTKLHRFLFFWHCVVLYCLGLLFCF